jgi:hypothetical protein
VVTALTASTDYSGTPSIIHCDADYYDIGAGIGNTAVPYSTIAPLSGTATISAHLGTGSATAYLDYGRTPGFGSTVSASCTSGCTLAASVSKGLVYYRTRRPDGNAGPATPILVTGNESLH